MKKTRYLCIHDLPTKYRDNDVRDVFDRLTNVQNVQILKDGYSRHAIVTFSDVKSAALVANAGIKINDTHLKLDYYDSSDNLGNTIKLRDSNNGSAKLDFMTEDKWKIKPLHDHVQSSQDVYKQPEERSMNFRHNVQPLRPVQNSLLPSRDHSDCRGLKLSHLPPLSKLSDEHLRQKLFTEFRRCGRIQSVVLPSPIPPTTGDLHTPNRVAIITFRKSEDARCAYLAIRNGEKVLFSISVIAELHPGFSGPDEQSSKNSSSTLPVCKIDNPIHSSSSRTTTNPTRPFSPSITERVFPTLPDRVTTNLVTSSKCPTRTLYVGGLTIGSTGPVTSEQLNTAFRKFGDIIDVQLQVTSNSALIQFMEIRGPTRAMNAHTRDPLKLGGRPLHLAYVPSSPNTNLWFSELPVSLAALSDGDLFRELAKIVPIQEVTLINRTDARTRSQSTQSPSTSVKSQNQHSCAAYIRLGSIEHASKLLSEIRSGRISTDCTVSALGDSPLTTSRRPFAVDFASPRQTTLVNGLHINAARSGESTRIRVLSATINGLKNPVSKQQFSSNVAKHSKWKSFIEPKPDEKLISNKPDHTESVSNEMDTSSPHSSSNLTDSMATKLNKVDSPSRRMCFTSAHLGRTFKSRDTSLSGSSTVSSSSLSSESSTESTSSSSSSLSSSSVSSSTSSGSSTRTKTHRPTYPPSSTKPEKSISLHSTDCSHRSHTRKLAKRKSQISKVCTPATSSITSADIEKQSTTLSVSCVTESTLPLHYNSVMSSCHNVRRYSTETTSSLGNSTERKLKPAIDSSLRIPSNLLNDSKAPVSVHVLSSNASSGVSSGEFSSAGSSPQNSFPLSKSGHASHTCHSTMSTNFTTTSSNTSGFNGSHQSGPKSRLYCTELSSGLKLHLSTNTPTSHSDVNQFSSDQSNHLTLSIKIGNSTSPYSPKLSSPSLNANFNLSERKTINRTLPTTPVSAPPIGVNSTKYSSPADDKLSLDGGMSSHSVDWYSTCSPVYESMYDKIKRRTNKEAEERRQRQMEAKSSKEKKRRKRCKKEEMQLVKSPAHSIPYTPDSFGSEYSGNTAITNSSCKSTHSRTNPTSPTKSRRSVTVNNGGKKKSKDTFSDEFFKWTTSMSQDHSWSESLDSMLSSKSINYTPTQPNHGSKKFQRESSPLSSSLSSDDAVDSSPPGTLTRLSLGMRFPVSATYHECPRPVKTSDRGNWPEDDEILGPLSSSLSSSSEHSAHHKLSLTEDMVRDPSSTVSISNGPPVKSRGSKSKGHLMTSSDRRKDSHKAHRAISKSNDSWNPKSSIKNARCRSSIPRPRDVKSLTASQYANEKYGAKKSGLKRSAKNVSNLHSPPKRLRSLFGDPNENALQMTSELKRMYDSKAYSQKPYFSNKNTMYAQIHDIDYPNRLSPTLDEVKWDYGRRHARRLSADVHSGTDDSSLPVTRSPSPLHYNNLVDFTGSRGKRIINESVFGIHNPMDLARTGDSVFDSDQFSTTSKSTPCTEPMEQAELIERYASLKFSDDEWHSDGGSSSPHPHLDFDEDFCPIDKTEQSSTTYQSNSFSSQMLSPVRKLPSPSPDDSEDEPMRIKMEVSLSSCGDNQIDKLNFSPVPQTGAAITHSLPVIQTKQSEPSTDSGTLVPCNPSPLHEFKKDADAYVDYPVTKIGDDRLDKPFTCMKSSPNSEICTLTKSNFSHPVFCESSTFTAHPTVHCLDQTSNAIISPHGSPQTFAIVRDGNESILLSSTDSVSVNPIALKDQSDAQSALSNSEPTYRLPITPLLSPISDVKPENIKCAPVAISIQPAVQSPVSKRQKSTSESQKSTILAVTPSTKQPTESCDITRYVQSVIERVKAERVGETQTTTNQSPASSTTPTTAASTIIQSSRTESPMSIAKRPNTHRKSLVTTSASTAKPITVATQKWVTSTTSSLTSASQLPSCVTVSTTGNLSPTVFVTSSPLSAPVGLPLPSIPGVNACAPLAMPVSGRITRQSNSVTKNQDAAKMESPTNVSNVTTVSTRRRRRSDGKNISSMTKDSIVINTPSEVELPADVIASTTKPSSGNDDANGLTSSNMSACVQSRNSAGNESKPCSSVDPYEPNFDEESPPGFDHSQLHSHRATPPTAPSPTPVVSKTLTPKSASTVATSSPIPPASCPSPISSISSQTGSHTSAPIVPTTVASQVPDSVDEVIREVCAGQFDIQSYLNGLRCDIPELATQTSKDSSFSPKSAVTSSVTNLSVSSSIACTSASMKPFPLGLTSEPVVAAVTIPVGSSSSVNKQAAPGKSGCNAILNTLLQALQLIPGSQVTVTGPASGVGLSGVISATTITLPVNATHQAAEKIKAAVLSATGTIPSYMNTGNDKNPAAKVNMSTIPSSAKLLNASNIPSRTVTSHLATTTTSNPGLQIKPTYTDPLLTSTHLTTTPITAPNKRVRQSSGPSINPNIPPKSVDLASFGLSAASNSLGQGISHQLSNSFLDFCSNGLPSNASTSVSNCPPLRTHTTLPNTSSFSIGHKNSVSNSPIMPPTSNQLLNIAGLIHPYVSSPSQPITVASQQPASRLVRPTSASVCTGRNPPITTTSIPNFTMQSIHDQLSGVTDPSVLLTLAQAALNGGLGDAHLLSCLRHFTQQLSTNDVRSPTGAIDKSSVVIDSQNKHTTTVNINPLPSSTTNPLFSQALNQRLPLSSTSSLCISTISQDVTLPNGSLGRPMGTPIDSNALISPPVPVPRSAPPSTNSPMSDSALAAGEALWNSIGINYPLVWQGRLSLKNTETRVALHYVYGNSNLLHDCMRLLAVGGGGQSQHSLVSSGGPLRIVQRMRLEPTQLEGVQRKIDQDGASCMCLALPAGNGPMELMQQTQILNENFIRYMQEKMAAGIINVGLPDCQQGLYVVHIFPPCEFSYTQLNRAARDLQHRVLQANQSHLLVVITTV